MLTSATEAAMQQPNGLTKEEEAQLTVLLGKLRWGTDTRVSPALFDAICGAVTTVCMELIVVRRGLSGGKEVLLTERPATDAFYAGQVHGPGGVVYGHQTVEDVQQRVVEKELRLRFLDVYHMITFLGARLVRPPRGQEVALIYELALPDGLAMRVPGVFHPLGVLPKNTIPHHRKMFDDYLWGKLGAG